MDKFPALLNAYRAERLVSSKFSIKVGSQKSDLCGFANEKFAHLFNEAELTLQQNVPWTRKFVKKKLFIKITNRLVNGRAKMRINWSKT